MCSKWKRERQRRDRKAAFSCFSLEKDCTLCESFIVSLSSWQRPQKLQFISPEHLALLRAGPERQGGMPFPLLTLECCTKGTPGTVSTRVRDYSCWQSREEVEQYICSIYLHFFSRDHNAPLDSMEREHFQSGMKTHPVNEAFFLPFGSFKPGQQHNTRSSLHNTHSVNSDALLLFSTILTHQILFTQCSRERKRGLNAILGHCNVCHSANCSSNCRGRGIFDI